MSDSSLLVYSWGWVGGFLLRALPQGLQRALFSLLQVTLGFPVTGGLYFCFPGDMGWAPAVFPLHVMQLAALLGFHTWLTQVGCPTPAVMVSRGVGVVLVQMSCYPLVFLSCACAASPSAASPSGFCTLNG